MRWRAPDGTVWASRFEYSVYVGISEQLGSERIYKCDEKDSLGYTSVVKNADCTECRSRKVVQRRTLVTDLFVVSAHAAGRRNEQSGYFVETKGFIRAHQRALLRDFIKCNPDLDLRFIIEKDYTVSKSRTLGQWIDSFLKKPWCVWTGQLPQGWL